MPFSINPDLIENNDVEIQTVDGELALFHKPSGNTLIIDEDTTVSEKLQSPLRDNVDFDGNDLISGGSGEFAALDAGSVNTEVLNNKPAGVTSSDTGQFIHIAGGSFPIDTEFSNTEFEQIGPEFNTPTVGDFDRLNIDRYEVAVSFGRIGNVVSEAEFRIAHVNTDPVPGTQETFESDSSFLQYIGPGEFDPFDAGRADRFTVEGRVDEGSAELTRTFTYQIFGVVGE